MRARALALSMTAIETARDQIEDNDDPMVREKFHSEPSRKGLLSAMPGEA